MKNNLLLLFMLSLIIIALPNKSFAAENLQAIIDSLDEGAVLQLENKTYEGNITINKPIEIIGAKETIIKGDRTGNVISVRAPSVKIKNVTIINSSLNRNSAEEYAAIKLYTNHNFIDGVTIKQSYHGIYLSQSHDNTVQNSTIIGLGKNQIANQGNGLQVYYSNNNKLINNVIKQTRDGMYFTYANDNQSINNHISETRYGLHYMFSDRNTFTENTFSFNTGGAAIMNSNELKLERNQFIFNYGHKSFGLLLLSANDNVIRKNTFSLNQRGMYIDQATRNSIRDNRIVQNQIGIELWASSNDQTFSQNTIAENTIPVVSLGGSGTNHWSENQKGNDWGASFPVADLNQDGIGDQPVAYQSSLYELIEDQELTYLFLKTPAIAVYEKINQFFNNDKTMFEDSYPIVKKDSGFNLYPALPISLVILIIIIILIKGRRPLCITFGKNGKKT